MNLPAPIRTSRHRMDYKEPKTRRESKKDQRTKGHGVDGKYSAKHIRIQENGFKKFK